ncbi:hypothetical protein [Neorhodopirellula lusitana]|uniref:hypothetical protein n=1 Tax=Neorhodopirellula lusitana TaxID=445327 RepID=UPI00385055EA
MLAPVVLPFQITCLILVVVWFAGVIWLRAPKRVGLLTLAVAFAFIPSCTGVMFVVDAYRYGRFEYESTADIPSDGYIELPDAATDITLFRHGAGNFARFSIDTGELHGWIDQQRSLQPELNAGLSWDNRENVDDEQATQHEYIRTEMLVLNQELFALRFPETGWQYDPTMIQAQVSRSRRGGGYTIWHVPATGDTYLSASYW